VADPDRLKGTAALVEYLENWLAATVAERLDESSSVGVKAKLFVDIGGHQVRVNSDTRRGAIREVVRLSRSRAPLTWYVIRNAKGKTNKVVPDAQHDLPGWYAYIEGELDRPGPIG
jgi:hypothetical protein